MKQQMTMKDKIIKEIEIDLEHERKEHVCTKLTLDMREKELKSEREVSRKYLADKEAECNEELSKKEKECIRLKDKLKNKDQ